MSHDHHVPTFIERILLTVSIRVSPFLTEDCAAEKADYVSRQSFLGQFKGKFGSGTVFRKDVGNGNVSK